MKKMATAFYAIGFLLSATTAGFSCDYCLLSQGLSPLQTTAGVGLRIDERYTELDKMYSGRKEMDTGNRVTHLTTQATAFYAINPDLTAMVIVPYVRRTMKEWDDMMAMYMKGDARGLGDIVAMGRYTFYRRHTLDATTMLAGVAGVKFPTGDTDEKDDMGNYMDAHIQPGSGSTDMLLGLNLSHAWGRFTLASNLLYSVNGEGEAGAVRHEFGDSLNYDATVVYRIHPATAPGPTVSLAFGLAGEWRDKEKTDGATEDGTEGHVVYLTTGVLFMPNPHWIVELNYRPSIYHYLPAGPSGEGQMGESYKVTASLTYLL
jgi:hypothetical protein